MTTAIKVLALLWTLLFAYIAFGTIKASSDSTPPTTVEEVMRKDPTLTRAQAAERVKFEQGGKALGAACCLTFGLPVLLVVWVVGLGGLGLMFLMFRKRTPTAPIELEDDRSRRRR